MQLTTHYPTISLFRDGYNTEKKKELIYENPHNGNGRRTLAHMYRDDPAMKTAAIEIFVFFIPGGIPFLGKVVYCCCWRSVYISKTQTRNLSTSINSSVTRLFITEMIITSVFSF
jgi:hypothetical protein